MGTLLNDERFANIVAEYFNDVLSKVKISVMFDYIAKKFLIAMGEFQFLVF